jgi:tRNA-dihydrouridine synthase 1
MGSDTSQAPGQVDVVEEKEAQRCEEAWDWWRRIGSPRYTCAPMVNNSELAFRRLVRRHGCQLTYSPMIVARKFVALPSDEARCALVEYDAADRPFIVQFAGDNPEDILEAGRIIQRLGLADAIDLNLGCPQAPAVRDHYGSILMEEPELVERIVAAAAHGLAIPVTVKMRVFKDVERTVAFARRMERAGAALLAVRRDFIELMTTHRKLKASREGSN